MDKVTEGAGVRHHGLMSIRVFIGLRTNCTSNGCYSAAPKESIGLSRQVVVMTQWEEMIVTGITNAIKA